MEPLNRPATPPVGAAPDSSRNAPWPSVTLNPLPPDCVRATETPVKPMTVSSPLLLSRKLPENTGPPVTPRAPSVIATCEERPAGTSMPRSVRRTAAVVVLIANSTSPPMVRPGKVKTPVRSPAGEAGRDPAGGDQQGARTRRAPS